MNKVKRILTVVLAMAMVLTMSVTSLAAETGKTGTITVNDIKVENGVTVTAYKVVEPDQTSTTGYKNLVTNEAYDVEEDGIEAFSADTEIVGLSSKALTKGTDTQKNGATYATYSTSNLDPGMYLIKVTGSSITYSLMLASIGIDTAGDAVVGDNSTITAKSSDTFIEKTATSGDSDASDVAVGDVISYTVKSVIPNYGETYTGNITFEIKDTISDGLDFEGTVSVTIGGSEAAGVNPMPNGKTLTVSIPSDTVKANPGAEVVLTYSAKVNQNAVTGFNANTNKAELEYTNNPDGSTGTKEDQTRHYTFEIDGDITGLNKLATTEIVKVDTDEYKETTTVTENSKKLSGAEFALYKDEKCTEEVGTAISDANGAINFKGLDGDVVYYLKETKAPTGYSRSDVIITIKFVPTYGTDTDGNKILTKYDVDVNGETVATYSGSTDENGAAVNVSGGVSTTNNGTTYKPALIKNTKLSALPSTGGIGTTIFTVVGCLIMIAAAAMFFVSRRRTER